MSPRNFSRLPGRLVGASALAVCVVIAGAFVTPARAETPAQAAKPARAATAAAAPAPLVFVDADHDGIDDALEQSLAEKFAPVIFMEPGEENYPVNVDWHLQRGFLWYHEDCLECIGECFDCDDEAAPAPAPIGDQATLIGAPWVHPDSFGTCHDETGQGSHCGEGESAHRRISTVARDPDGEGPTGYSDQTSFFIPDLADQYHIGSLTPDDWVTYFHCYPTADGGAVIQYWHTFARNDFPFDDHGGDWDASIQVQLDGDFNLTNVWFSRHNDDSPGTSIPADQLTLYQGTHTQVTIDGGGHASFASPQDWCDNPHYSGPFVGQLSDIAWTVTPDDPATLQTITCRPTAFGDEHGGTVWKTWTGGDVRQGGPDVDNHISVSPSAHGGLVNLGEYNPCTAADCQGTRQASTLLAGEFHPLNGQIFIAFEGRWGSFGTIVNGPRGPVFQGFRDGVYTAWYNQGADVVPTAPAITINEPRAVTYLHSDTITLDYAVADGTGSHAQDVTPRMDGKTALDDGTGLANGRVINLLTEMLVGDHTFSIDADNEYGAPSARSVTFSIIVTDASIATDVQQFLAAGSIRQDEARSLLGKLASAAKARAKGNCANAITIYQSFISEVQAQSGKKIDPAAAQVLIADAQYLIDHCP